MSFQLEWGQRSGVKRRGKTTYSIRAIPFGGFVAMAGEEAEKEMVKVGSSSRCQIFHDNGLVDRDLLKARRSKARSHWND